MTFVEANTFALRSSLPENRRRFFRRCGEEQERMRERGLDNTLAETFPCSDALSSIPDPVT